MLTVVTAAGLVEGVAVVGAGTVGWVFSGVRVALGAKKTRRAVNGLFPECCVRCCNCC